MVESTHGRGRGGRRFVHRSLSVIVRKHLKEFVHPGARVCKLERARHETFIFAQLVTIAVAGLFIPPYLGATGADAIWRVAAVGWFIVPGAAIAHLARSG